MVDKKKKRKIEKRKAHPNHIFPYKAKMISSLGLPFCVSERLCGIRRKDGVLVVTKVPFASSDGSNSPSHGVVVRH